AVSSRTSSRVSGLSAREAVAGCTPARAATSRRVTVRSVIGTSLRSAREASALPPTDVLPECYLPAPTIARHSRAAWLRFLGQRAHVSRPGPGGQVPAARG